MSDVWLSVVGVGEEGLAALSPRARRAVAEAEFLVGAERYLAMLPDDGRPRSTWPQPFATVFDALRARRGRPVCVLATGDPLHFGVGATLLRHFPSHEMRIFPAPSAFSLACARLGWERETVETLSLHGRPLGALHAHLQPGQRLLLLSWDRHTPAAVAALLAGRGFGASRLWVLEHLGGEREHCVTGRAEAWRHPAGEDFNTVAVECHCAAETAWLPRVPGLPDASFQHDGQLTKREVRAATVAALAPAAGQLLWDVGAGAGSVAIEWLRAARGTRAIAIEGDPDRAARIAQNAEALGTPGLEIVRGRAPTALAELPTPDAVFAGGGIAAPDLLAHCWERLPRGGRLVANAVSSEGEAALLAAAHCFGGQLIRIAVSHWGPLGGQHCFRPALPVTQLAVTKP